MFSDYDDLSVISNDLSDRSGPTLIAIVRNEMYMLPAFLAHYRALGIARFIFLDDQSDDDTRAYLARQPDAMVLESPVRYGQVIAPQGRIPLPDMRSNIVWRNVLMGRYGRDRWTLLLDVDEFLALPQGMTIPDLIARAEADGRRAVTGIMLDLYPENIADLATYRPFDPEMGWYFDGQPHLRLREGGAISTLYPGARARLAVRYGLHRIGLRNRVRNLVRAPWYPGVNLNEKAVLHCWGESDLFLNAHKTTALASGRLLLPIKHYKFTTDLYRKVEMALAEQRYAGGSVEYRLVEALLQRMTARGGGFRYSLSRAAEGFEPFAATGNAQL